ncbi:MAG: Maf family nucleotide pyrophosphatase [Spirosomataceae bacterium]
MKLSKSLLLASNSPRRRQILSEAGFTFDVQVKPTDELFPSTMPPDEVPVFLAIEKAAAFDDLPDDTLLLTADTVVLINGEILNKPSDSDEAFVMLRKLSGQMHQVITGVCLRSNERIVTFADTTKVYFKELTDEEIRYYIKTCHPFDKAGSYGVQDFIGMAGIERIEGSFFTVMGLPIHRVYEALKPYVVWDE